LSTHPCTHIALSEVAEVRFSSVDKHTIEGETPVRLCNYTDVFKNRFVADSMDFMAASATESEIERFGLRHGDIAITKDSETPEEIGIPALIERPSADLVLGYHLALIRAKADRCDPYFLAAALQSRQVARHYLRTAVGLTRFGLSIKAVADTPIPNIPLSTQRKIGRLYRESARLESHTDALIAAKREQKRGLMQQLLTGKVRFPGFTEPWKTVRLEDVADVRFSNVDKHTVPSERQVRLCNYTDVFRNRFLHPDMDFMSASATAREVERFGLQAGDVAITKDSETPDEIGVPALVDRTAPDLVLGYHLALLRADRSKLDPGFLLILMESDLVRAHFQRRASGLTRFALSIGAVADTPILLPPVGEQGKIAKLYRDLTTEESLLREMHASFASQRRGLMERLLSGDLVIPSSETSAA